MRSRSGATRRVTSALASPFAGMLAGSANMPASRMRRWSFFMPASYAGSERDVSGRRTELVKKMSGDLQLEVARRERRKFGDLHLHALIQCDAERRLVGGRRGESFDG